VDDDSGWWRRAVVVGVLVGRRSWKAVWRAWWTRSTSHRFPGNPSFACLGSRPGAISTCSASPLFESKISMSSKRCPLIGIGQLDPYLIAELRDRTRMLRTVTLTLTPPTVDPLIQTPSSAVSIVESCSCTHTKTMKMKTHETAHEICNHGFERRHRCQRVPDECNGESKNKTKVQTCEYVCDRHRILRSGTRCKL
jgi:hypothetical protein